MSPWFKHFETTHFTEETGRVQGRETHSKVTVDVRGTKSPAHTPHAGCPEPWGRVVWVSAFQETIWLRKELKLPATRLLARGENLALRSAKPSAGLSQTLALQETSPAFLTAGANNVLWRLFHVLILTVFSWSSGVLCDFLKCYSFKSQVIFQLVKKEKKKNRWLPYNYFLVF